MKCKHIYFKNAFFKKTSSLRKGDIIQTVYGEYENIIFAVIENISEYNTYFGLTAFKIDFRYPDKNGRTGSMFSADKPVKIVGRECGYFKYYMFKIKEFLINLLR